MYIEETRCWLAENLKGHPDILVLKNNLELRIRQLWNEYQPVQVMDQGWINYLNGLEDGDFRDEEVHDQQEYFDSSRYMDTLMDAMSLEAELQLRIEDIDGLRRSSPIVVPPVYPPIQQVPPRHSLDSEVIAQARKDGSASAVPSTSVFLTGNGGSFNQADPNAPQKVGTDQLADDMPSPSDAHHGFDDRKPLSQRELSQQGTSLQLLSQQPIAQRQPPQQQSSQQQQEQGMDPLPRLSEPERKSNKQIGLRNDLKALYPHPHQWPKGGGIKIVLTNLSLGFEKLTRPPSFFVMYIVVIFKLRHSWKVPRHDILAIVRRNLVVLCCYVHVDKPYR